MPSLKRFKITLICKLAFHLCSYTDFPVRIRSFCLLLITTPSVRIKICILLFWPLLLATKTQGHEGSQNYKTNNLLRHAVRCYRIGLAAPGAVMQRRIAKRFGKSNGEIRGMRIPNFVGNLFDGFIRIAQQHETIF